MLRSVPRVIGYDLETFRFRPGLACPKGVCLSWSEGDDALGLALIDEGVELFRSWVTDPNIILTAHNAAYDLGVLCAEDASLVPLIFAAADAGRLRCSKIREKIIHNAIGELKYEWDEDLKEFKKSRYDLQRLVRLHFGVTIAKDEDTWRKRYCELAAVPLEQWPDDAKKYAIEDALWHRRVYMAQEECGKVVFGGPEILGAAHVTRTALALAMLKSWGVRTHGPSVAVLRDLITRQYEDWVALATSFNMVRPPGVKGGPATRNVEVIRDRVKEVYAERGLNLPMSESGKNISHDRETLSFTAHQSLRREPWTVTIAGVEETHQVVDRALFSVSQVVKYQKLKTTYIPILESGIEVPITPDWNEMVETFRTSCGRPNLQNQGREGSIRRCFVPRWTYVDVEVPDDYQLQPGEEWVE